MPVYKRNGKWRFRVSYKKHDGSYGRINSKIGYEKKKEAENAESEVIMRLYRGNDLKAGEMLFTAYFEEWFEIFREGKNSIENDKDIRRAIDFARKYFPVTTLSSLTRKEYQAALNKFGKTHATATVKKHHTYMRMCIKEAIQEGIIFKDPTYNIKAWGQVPEKRESEKYLSKKEAQLLIKQLLVDFKHSYTSRHIILFMLATGTRFSEAIGLTWDCVDFENKAVKINKTWDYKYTNDFSNTKNYASVRTITVDQQTIENLKQLKKWQIQEKLKQNLVNKKDLVFISSSDELPVTNTAVNKTLRKFQKKVGCRELITSHGLRHTHASILLYRGLNIKYVSRRLGHNTIVTTLETYSHIIDELEQKGSREVDNVMNEIYGVI